MPAAFAVSMRTGANAWEAYCTVISDGLRVDPAIDAADGTVDGVAVVEAADEASAIRAAVVGSATVNTSILGPDWTDLTHAFPGGAFRVDSDAEYGYWIALDDTTGGPWADADFNDAWWGVAVDQVPDAVSDESFLGTETGTYLPLENDTSADGGSLAIVAVGTPLSGTATFTSSTVTYVPSTSDVAYDSFTYTIADARGNRDTATISLARLEGEATTDGTATYSFTYADGLSDDKSPAAEPVAGDTVSPAANDPGGFVLLRQPAPQEEPAAPPTADNLQWRDFQQVDERIPVSLPNGGFGTAAAVSKIGFARRSDPGKWEAVRVVDRGGGKGNYVIQFKRDLLPAVSGVEAIFDRSGSKVFKESANGPGSAALLSHERFHLRIAEYVAAKSLLNKPDFKSTRFVIEDVAEAEVKLQADIGATLKANELLGKFDETLQAINSAVQEKYDGETKFGDLGDKQQDWERNYQKYADEVIKSKGWKTE